MMQISVILPAYNEERNITKALSNSYKYLKSRYKSFEIIVVNDGSLDDTVRLVKDFAKKHGSVRLINHGHNLGYGSALRSGFMSAKGDLVFYTDSDNQYDIAELDNLKELIKKYDIVAGYRTKHSDPTTRILISYVYNLLIMMLLGLEIKDVDCSFKLYKKKVFDSIELKCKTGLIDAEVLIKARKKGFKICQVGVSHYPRVEGNSIYEIGKRNKIFALVSPKVPLEIFKEIKNYWHELT